MMDDGRRRRRYSWQFLAPRIIKNHQESSRIINIRQEFQGAISFPPF
jgi:hypothetical protein